MENSGLFGPSSPVNNLEYAMKGLSLRSKAIAGNIANINTPDYKRQVVNFEETLQKQSQKQESDPDVPDVTMAATAPGHLAPEETVRENSLNISIEEDQTFHTNGNSVDIDREMVELSKTGLRFKALTKLAGKRFENMKGIIRG
ncbi:MAG: flagellar basal body rod protein FlgB [Candidatus Melainabacteria bacterium]|nr:flagellar basal body rod protein FlgB [Candidatus Melainabacteria bacterium]